MLRKLKMAAAVPRTALAPLERPRPASGRGGPSVDREIRQLIGIGTSTGGPRALDTVLGSLPSGFPHPILIVQHMPPHFTRMLAQRLHNISPLRVKEAEDGEPIRAGTAYVAPGGFHMTADDAGGSYVIRLNQEEPRSGHRPSADVLFESIGRLSRLKRHYVLMTGMGKDGARGMLLGKEQGAASTIAEAKETCVVFGMPRAAIEYQCTDHIVPLDRIAAKLVEVTQRAGRKD